MRLIPKLVSRILLGIVLLLVIAGIIVYFSLDHIVKNTVEKEASSSLNLATTLNSARLSLFGGKLNLKQLDIASPPGFSAPHMLELSDTDVAVSYGQLRNDPVHVESLTLDKPRLVIEQQNGTLNFKKAMDLMPPSESSSQKSSRKLIIDELKVQDAQVVIHPNVPGLANEIMVPVPSIEMKNVGTGEGAQNGAAMKDVVMQVVTALAGSASNSSSIPDQLKALLHVNIGDVVGRLSGEAQKRIAAAIPGQFGKTLAEVVKDPQALAKDPTKALQQELGNLMGGKSQNGNATSQPADLKNRAMDAVQGLFGNKKQKSDSGK